MAKVKETLDRAFYKKNTIKYFNFMGEIGKLREQPKVSPELMADALGRKLTKAELADLLEALNRYYAGRYGKHLADMS
jgi:hypothetical protein